MYNERSKLKSSAMTKEVSVNTNKGMSRATYCATVSMLCVLVTIGFGTLLAACGQVDQMAVPLPGTVTPTQAYISYDDSLASGVRVETFPASAPDDLVPVPEHKAIILTDSYASTRRLYRQPAGLDTQAKLMIFPIADYEAVSPLARERILTLRSLLAERPTSPVGEIPLLPLVNGSQMFHSQLAYIDFANGSGVRFLTQYAQEPRNVNNSEVFYTFQGLTLDGSYYIAAFFPVSTQSLPEDDTILRQDYAAFEATYGTYLPATVQALDSLIEQDFEPNLAKLDAILQSLQVQTN
jgi:hypothetical protein